MAVVVVVMNKMVVAMMNHIIGDGDDSDGDEISCRATMKVDVRRNTA